MNECGVCNVKVHPQHGVCPLCGKRVGEPAASATAYPVYADNGSKPRHIIRKLLLFLVIAASVVSVFINIMTSDGRGFIWSAVVSVSLIGAWFLFRLTVAKRISSGGKVLYSFGIVSVYLITIDALTSFNKWSTTYVIPFLTIGVAVTFTIIALTSSANFKAYLGYLIGVSFISLCPILIFIFSLSTQAWTGFVAALYCLLTVVGLIIFQADNFKREVAKQFHF